MVVGLLEVMFLRCLVMSWEFLRFGEGLVGFEVVICVLVSSGYGCFE